MSSLRRFLRGLAALLRPQRAEDDLDEELRGYLDASIEEKLRAGMEHDDAVRAARLQFGSVTAVKDRVRDAGWEARLDSLWRDVRYAARTLRKSRAFTAVAVLTLALGIGVNAAIFSAVNAIMLRQLPVDRPHELVSLAAVYPNGIETVFSFAGYRRLRDDGAHLIDAAATSTVRRDAIAIAIDGPPEAIDLTWVSGNYFTTLGVGAAIGRTLVSADDTSPPGQPVAVLSDAFWARRFGRDAAVIGRSFRLRTATFTIVGVAPPAFAGESAGETVDIWMPLSAQPGAPSWLWKGHSTTWLRILARRRPGIDLAQVRAGLEPVYARIRDEIAADTTSPEFRQSVLDSRIVVSDGSRGSSRLRDNLSAPLLVSMAIVGLVLLVACTNVANLMLARAAARRRETAVCLAIGAGRWRIVRQRMAEALLLAALGCTAGLLLAAWGTSVLDRLISGALPISLDLRPDIRVLAFAVVTSAATALVFGLLPALRATRVDPLGALKGGSGVDRSAARIPLGRTLVVTQIGVSLVLLVAAGLFVRSLFNLRSIDPGFDPDRVVLFRLSAAAAQPALSIATRRSLYRQMLERAENIPGVEGASASFSGLLSNDAWRNAVIVEGYAPPAGTMPRTFANTVSPRYFDVMRIAVLRGRPFTPEDHEHAPKVAIVNETFARQFFGGLDPLRRRVGLCSSVPCAETEQDMREIVGVAEDAAYTDLREDRRPMLYVPFEQFAPNLSEIQVRTAGDPVTVAATVYRALADADRRVAVVAMLQARDRVDASILPERMIAKLSAVFGLLALTLAAIGLYGLIAYVTARRANEIGIRMALGAQRRDVRRLVLRDTIKLAVIGTVIGIPVALAAARLVSKLLYQVAPGDPLALSLSVAALFSAALAAAYLPARRATQLDPAATLHAE